MVGMERKKENSAAVRRSSPSSNPPMMVAPERDTPGTMAMACATPISEAGAERDLLDAAIKHALSAFPRRSEL